MQKANINVIIMTKQKQIPIINDSDDTVAIHFFKWLGLQNSIKSPQHMNVL